MTERERVIERMLKDANDVLRSFGAVCDRQGAFTNWESLRTRVRQVLADQHQFMHPEHYASPRAG